MNIVKITSKKQLPKLYLYTEDTGGKDIYGIHRKDMAIVAVETSPRKDYDYTRASYLMDDDGQYCEVLEPSLRYYSTILYRQNCH